MANQFSRNRLLLFLPLILIIALSLLLIQGLQRDPRKLASALIGKPIPEFYQANLLNEQQILSNRDLPKQLFFTQCMGQLVFILQARTSFSTTVGG